jgi:hypothetical protein
MTREEAIDIIKHILGVIPKEPPTECDNVKEWLYEDDEIREALINMAIKALEQESVLDKIRNEFIDRYPHNYANELELGGRSCVFSLNEILQIIDKYRTESEKTNGK